MSVEGAAGDDDSDDNDDEEDDDDEDKRTPTLRLRRWGGRGVEKERPAKTKKSMNPATHTHQTRPDPDQAREVQTDRIREDQIKSLY